MSGFWTPTGEPNGYMLIVCSCVGGPHVGARKLGTPDCCEACGFITPGQMAYLREQISHRVTEKVAEVLEAHGQATFPHLPDSNPVKMSYQKAWRDAAKTARSVRVDT